MNLPHIYSGEVRTRATSSGSLSTRLDVNKRYQSVDFQAWQMKRLDVRAGEKILDVGCGTGAQSLHFLSDIGPTGSISALDLSAESVAALVAAAHGDSRLQAETADMADLPDLIRQTFRQKEYTLAQSTYALYYSPARADVLRTMAGSVLDGGRVAVFTPVAPHGMVDLAARFGDIPAAVYDSLNYGPGELTKLFRELFWDVRVDYFQSEMRVTSLEDFMAFYRATTYFDARAVEPLESHATRKIKEHGAIVYAKNGYLIQGRARR